MKTERAFRLKIANFHPLPCLYQTSRFITQHPPSSEPRDVLGDRMGG